MMATLPRDKSDEVMALVHNWLLKEVANIHELLIILGKLFYLAQYCSPARLCVNRMLDSLRRCPVQGVIHLSVEFRIDLAWFQCFLPQTDEVFLIHEVTREPVLLFVDAAALLAAGC